ncbi:MAG: AMP-binding protein [Clostridia bacterium]|nr:AMP-binding protein [Clostridia bacterium]
MRGMVYGKLAKNYDLYPCEEIFTLKELLIFAAKNHDEKTAFQFEENGSVTGVSYARFLSDVNALGTWLFAHDFRNMHIAVFGENSYAWIVAYFAVTCGRNVIVPIDKDASPEDFAYYVENSDCSAIFYSDAYADLPETLSPDIARFNLKQLPEMFAQGRRLLDEDCQTFVDTEPKPGDLASIVYTSGTTGRPKGVMLSHRNFCACTCGSCRHVNTKGASLLTLPLHHTYGLVVGVFCIMFYGCPIFINRSPKKLLTDFQKSHPYFLSTVPLIADLLLKNIWNAAKKDGKENELHRLIKISNFMLKFRVDLRSVFFHSILEALGGNLKTIVCGGAPLSQELVDGFRSFGIELFNGYGITECGPVVSVNRRKLSVPDSVGTPLCCNYVKIAENGEVLVKGDNVMLGYYHMPEETARAMEDGWFHTGDLGRLDEKGVLYITGRLKNLIILGNGENIPAEEIESRLYTIPYVKEAVAYGEGNTIVAELFLEENAKQTQTDVYADIKQLNKTLPQNRNIGKILIRDHAFPKTSTKKIIRSYGGTKHA